jgi:predicted nuclease of restriction endonuclease-like RecB superfamily
LCFATNTKGGRLADLELRHRRRARCEDRIRWEPRKLRLRLFSAAAQLVHTDHRHWLRFTARWPWTDVITQAIDRLHTLPNPG